MVILASDASARIFPSTNEVVKELCGASIVPTSSSAGSEPPCLAGAFAFAAAFESCSTTHRVDANGLRRCIAGCTTEDVCNHICVGGQSVSACDKSCRVLVACVQEVAKDGESFGPVSMASLLRECFHEGAASVGVNPVGNHLRGGRSVARLTIEPASELSPACGCTLTDQIRGVILATPGCGRHGDESAAGDSAYCFIDGGAECLQAKESSRHKGLYWTKCFAPDFDAIYPKGCELIQTSKFFKPPTDLPPVAPLALPGLPASTSSLRAQANYSLAHSNEATPSLGRLRRHLEESAKALPPEWHARHNDYFLHKMIPEPFTGPR